MDEQTKNKVKTLKNLNNKHVIKRKCAAFKKDVKSCTWVLGPDYDRLVFHIN